MNKNIPIWLGTGPPANTRLTAEIADGWLPLGYVPGKKLDHFMPWLEEGFRRAGGGKSLKDLEIQVGATVRITDDVQGALDAMKPGTALYIGGMGHRTKNFHNDNMVRRGYADAAARIQELFLAGRKEEATAAVPDEFLDETALIGPVERIRERYKLWADDPITGITVNATRQEEMELMAELAEVEPVKV